LLWPVGSEQSGVDGQFESRTAAQRLKRTFGLTRRLYDMPNPVTEPQTPVEIGMTNILDQRRRIERQRELIARLERDGSPDLVAAAVRILGQMKQALALMEVQHAAGQEQPSEVEPLS
jgi:hypothetical protein